MATIARSQKEWVMVNHHWLHPIPLARTFLTWKWIQEVNSQLILLIKTILTVKRMNQAILATIKYLIHPVPLVLIPECRHLVRRTNNFDGFPRLWLSFYLCFVLFSLVLLGPYRVLCICFKCIILGLTAVGSSYCPYSSFLAVPMPGLQLHWTTRMPSLEMKRPWLHMGLFLGTCYVWFLKMPLQHLTYLHPQFQSIPHSRIMTNPLWPPAPVSPAYRMHNCMPRSRDRQPSLKSGMTAVRWVLISKQ